MNKDEEIIRLKDIIWELINIIKGRYKQDKKELKYIRLIEKRINNKGEK